MIGWNIDGEPAGLDDSGYAYNLNAGDIALVLLSGNNEPILVEVLYRKWSGHDRMVYFGKTVEEKIPPDKKDIADALFAMADEAQNVVLPDGEFRARERVKDWFDYQTLEDVITTAERHGWKRRNPDD